MTQDQWSLVESHFEALADLQPADRASGLAAIGDEEVRREVASLLEHSGSGETVSAVVGAMADHVESGSIVDRRIGPYKLVRRLGQGGQGAVFEAIRDDGTFDQRVAIKIVKWEIDSDDARSRFRHERQILAGLEHPHIARLLDGGETSEGTPYLVMEYVDGEPITQYCSPLDRTARLRLFLKVCEAVEHAHRNLVVHRDLKPANILVTPNGDPKLLDFGIAKLLDPGSSKTQTAFLALTPDYASPEQVRGEPITTASDVYSLGVILYQMLTDRKPYTLDTATPLEMDRVICLQAPAPPELGDDLDHIILMALRKEPERRYGGVQRFAADIERYLDHRPVIARPDTAWYRTRKFARRNWVALAAASITVTGICGGASVAVYQAKIAQQRFNEVRQLANSFLFDFDKEIAQVPGNTRARQMLVTTARKYLDNLAATAGNDEDLLTELATSYEKLSDIQGMPGLSNLGLTPEAAASNQKAIAILERLAARNPKLRGRLAIDLGRSARIATELNQIDMAIRLAGHAAGLLDQIRAESPKDSKLARNAARGFDILSEIQDGSYRSEDAIDSGRKAVALYEQSIPRDAPPRTSLSLAIALVQLGLANQHLAEFNASESAFRQALDINKRILNINPDEINSRILAASLHERFAVLADSDRYPSMGNPDEALAGWSESKRIYSQRAATDPNDIRSQGAAAVADFNLAFIHLRRNAAGDLPLADRFSLSSAGALDEVVRKAPNAGFARAARPTTRFVRSAVLARQGHLAAAMQLSQTALEEQRVLARESGFTADNRLDLAGQLLRHAQVLVLCRESGAAGKASQEAESLFKGLDAEIKRWMSYAYQAGAYRFALAESMEQAARQFSDPKLLKDAAANYEEAARFWSPWESNRPYVKGRVTDARRKGALSLRK